MVSTPKAPDPVATANAQSAMNRETAITQMGLNAMDQYNPTGSVTYTQNGTWEDGTPRFQQTTTYNPEQQAIFDATTAAQGNLANIAQEQSAFLGEYLNDPFEFTNDDASQWAYDLASPRILQQQQQNEAQLRATLGAKGIREGSAAWDAEMARLTNANTDQLNQLALTGRSQAYNEALTGRNQPLNEIIGLMNGSQLQNPGAQSTATPQASVAGVDYTGLVNNQYQSQLANSQSMMGGLFGLGGSLGSAAIMASDRRLKTDITRVGSTEGGTPIYTYRYIWGGPVQMGVMAQDVPEAASDMGNGFLGVDYSKVA